MHEGGGSAGNLLSIGTFQNGEFLETAMCAVKFSDK
jgi:hypothetical protein